MSNTYPPPPPPQSSSPSTSSSSLSFTQGFLLGQLSIALLIAFFIKFFIFGESPTDISARRAKLRRQRPSFSQSARPDITGESYATSNNSKRINTSIIRPSPALTTSAILAKTYYNVNGHQPESVDWFNVLVAQTIAQLRNDAQQDNAILTSLQSVLNGPKKPEFVDEIKVTEINLGEEFPIFSNCRVTPVEPAGVGEGKDGAGVGRLQARMDVDLSDAITLGIETKLVLNYPRPLVAVMPVALAVSVVRFSGTLSISFIPSPSPAASPSHNSSSSSNANNSGDANINARPTSAPASFTHPINRPSHSHSPPPPPADPTPPTTLTFSFLPDYRLELSTHSLLGSRSRLQDVPKISQLVEARLHDWFDERCVEPRFQQVVLPSLWPRRKNTRGGDVDVDESSHIETINVPGAFDAGKAGKGSTEKQERTRTDLRTAVEGQHQQSQHQQQQQQQHVHAHQAPNTQQQTRPQPTTNTSTQQFRGGSGRNMMIPTDQLRQRYSTVYEGEVQSSPPRREDDHDHTEFVSGHDLAQRLQREHQHQQQQQQRKGRV